MTLTESVMAGRERETVWSNGYAVIKLDRWLDIFTHPHRSCILLPSHFHVSENESHKMGNKVPQYQYK